MDTSGNPEIERQRAAARRSREEASSQRREMERFRGYLRDMGREQRKMDAKLRKAEADSSTIDRERREAVDKVEGYQRAVDRATEEMRRFEMKIADLRNKIRIQQETNRLKKNQAFTCRLDADRLRTEAGTHCIQGAADRQIHGDQSKHRHLLQQAEEKSREAEQKDREAEAADREVAEGTHVLHALTNRILENGRRREQAEQDRAREERKVAEMATSLGMARDEVTNGSRACAAMVREMDHHTGNLARAEEAARRAEEEAGKAEAEAARLEAQLRSQQERAGDARRPSLAGQRREEGAGPSWR